MTTPIETTLTLAEARERYADDQDALYILARVAETPQGCWDWQLASSVTKRYGRVETPRRAALRALKETALLSERWIGVRCGNKMCVRPAHCVAGGAATRRSRPRALRPACVLSATEVASITKDLFRAVVALRAAGVDVASLIVEA